MSNKMKVKVCGEAAGDELLEDIIRTGTHLDLPYKICSNYFGGII